MSELKTIKLIGAAGRQFGREFRLAVQSPAEAIRALCALFPEFHGWVLEQHARGVAWRVITDDATGISDDELTRSTGAGTIVLAPVLSGAGAVGKIIIGVVLIAVAIFVPFAAVGGGLGIGLLGGSLLLSGVAELLTPTPKLTDSPSTAAENSADLESNLFSRNQGTSGQGECVPLVYGQRRIEAPRLVSFNLRTQALSRDINVTGTRGLLGYVNNVALS